MGQWGLLLSGLVLDQSWVRGGWAAPVWSCPLACEGGRAAASASPRSAAGAVEHLGPDLRPEKWRTGHSDPRHDGGEAPGTPAPLLLLLGQERQEGDNHRGAGAVAGEGAGEGSGVGTGAGAEEAAEAGTGAGREAGERAGD